uniref:Poly [ADP-ribose] polymerase 12-like n=1 Tax=Sinocyclocheilus grahami TaxID=75366 RepID=A0A672SMR9_SINGR
MTEAAIVKKICAHTGSMSYDALTSIFGLHDEAVASLVGSSGSVAVAFVNGQKTVIARTKVRLCRVQSCPGCANLHLCKWLLLGCCRFHRGSAVKRLIASKIKVYIYWRKRDSMCFKYENAILGKIQSERCLQTCVCVCVCLLLEKTEICMYFIKGFCKHVSCRREHSNLPYKWEVKEGSEWKALPDNEAIEKDYCNAARTYSSGMNPVYFDTMTQGSHSVRRLSTVPSVLQPTFILTTEWVWYWEDEDGNWIQYATAEGGHRLSSISSAELEQKYQADNNTVVEFTAESQTYELSFTDMIQTNKRYTTKKVVRRRPKFVSAADVRTIKTARRTPNNFKALPEHWDKALTPETGYKSVWLQSTSAEYIKIKELFSRTMVGFRILKIERIQNKALWEVYQWQKDFMKKNNGGRDVTEKQLFHGTDSTHLDAICRNNFDWRICGTHGTAYGKGSYFARDAKYSHSYTKGSGTRSMFVCRILVGSYTKGESSYLRPPSKDGGDTVFYDSCVNDVFDPSVFVVFEKHQIYPEYLIEYSDSSGASPSQSSSSTTPKSTSTSECIIS